MLKLEDREWKAFNLIDKQLFYIEEVATLNSTSLTNEYGTLDVVGATSRNNGHVGFLDNKHKNLLINGNCICLIKTGQGSVGDAVYKNNNFVSSNNVAVIRGKFLNKYVGLFVTTLIDKQSNRYSYGYIRNNQRILKEKILLPITPLGDPDYQFMEDYMKERIEQKIDTYLDYVNRHGGGERTRPNKSK